MSHHYIILYARFIVICIVYSKELLIKSYMVSEVGSTTANEEEAVAGLHIQLPEPFDFKLSDGWLKWKRPFGQYHAESGLSGESVPRQVSTQLYCLGEEANNVVVSTNTVLTDRITYTTIVAKFNEFFEVAEM